MLRKAFFQKIVSDFCHISPAKKKGVLESYIAAWNAWQNLRTIYLPHFTQLCTFRNPMRVLNVRVAWWNVAKCWNYIFEKNAWVNQRGQWKRVMLQNHYPSKCTDLCYVIGKIWLCIHACSNAHLVQITNPISEADFFPKRLSEYMYMYISKFTVIVRWMLDQISAEGLLILWLSQLDMELLVKFSYQYFVSTPTSCYIRLNGGCLNAAEGYS